jgi:hypothetical protein
MYLHEFCGSWMEHPFWRAKFVLKDPKDLERIQATAIEEVWIDISKGLDVAGQPSVSRAKRLTCRSTEFASWWTCQPSSARRAPPPCTARRSRHHHAR